MFDSLERCAIYLDGTYSQLPSVAKCFSLCRTTALAKNGPLALGKSDPREEHDLSQGKKKASAGEMLLFLVARSFSPNQFVFPSAQRPTGASCLALNGSFRAGWVVHFWRANRVISRERRRVCRRRD